MNRWWFMRWKWIRICIYLDITELENYIFEYLRTRKDKNKFTLKKTIHIQVKVIFSFVFFTIHATFSTELESYICENLRTREDIAVAWINQEKKTKQTYTDIYKKLFMLFQFQYIYIFFCRAGELYIRRPPYSWRHSCCLDIPGIRKRARI